ncbi:MAG: hypothetical protein Q7J77_09015 [Undibacterium sp.]|nr:hypothetical protein [Undibacterium sp.]
MKAENIKHSRKPTHGRVRPMSIEKKGRKVNQRKTKAEAESATSTPAQSPELEGFDNEHLSKGDIERGDTVDTLPPLERQTENNEEIDLQTKIINLCI